MCDINWRECEGACRSRQSTASVVKEGASGERESLKAMQMRREGAPRGGVNLCRFSCKYHRDPWTWPSHLINTDWKVSPEFGPRGSALERFNPSVSEGAVIKPVAKQRN